MVFRAIPREVEPRSRYNDTSAALSNASEQVPGRPKRGAAQSHLLVPTKCRSHDSPENRSQTAYAARLGTFDYKAARYVEVVYGGNRIETKTTARCTVVDSNVGKKKKDTGI